MRRPLPAGPARGVDGRFFTRAPSDNAAVCAHLLDDFSGFAALAEKHGHMLFTPLSGSGKE
jgi:hypothetical protein